MPQSIDERLEHARRELLDLTARNRLINTPLGRGRSTRLDVVDELSSEVYRILVEERHEMSFLPGLESSAEVEENVESDPEFDGTSTDQPAQDHQPFSQPEESNGAGGLADRHTDRALQTALLDEKLQTTLLRIRYDAKTLLEEQGVNSLYLAMGFLEWYESPSSDKPRHAPLILLPAEIDRRTVNARFRLRALDEELSTNLSLQAKLKVDFGVVLPDLGDAEELDPIEYMKKVEESIANQPRWRVHQNRMVLAFFSFAKFLMFRDLDTKFWPEGKGPLGHPLVRGLLGDEITFEPALIGDNEPLDQRLDTRSLRHVLDADGSQAAAIEEARQGRNLVIQGPPGTGKSQSIANIIATAIADRKTVLFVAEKLAALQVVKSRLDQIGLGDACLELHSHKSNRRAVLDDLRRTLALDRSGSGNVENLVTQLVQTRDRLNAYVGELHTLVEPFGRTPYEIMGRLCRLLTSGITCFETVIPGVSAWTLDILREKQSLLKEAAQHCRELGVPNSSVWRGVQRTRQVQESELPMLRQRFSSQIDELAKILEASTNLARCMSVAWTRENASYQSVQRLAQLGTKLLDVPDMDRVAFADPVWDARRLEIQRVIEQGRKSAACREALKSQIRSGAWSTDVAAVRAELAATGRSPWKWFSGRWRRASQRMSEILADPLPKSLQAQLDLLDSLIQGQVLFAELDDQAALGSVGRAAFGMMWKGSNSDWSKLAKIVEFEAECQPASLNKSFRQVVAKWTDQEATRTACQRLREVFKKSWESLRALVEKELEVDVPSAFDASKLIEVSFSDLNARLTEWRDVTPSLGRWIVFQRLLRRVREAGLGALVPQIQSGLIDDSSVDRLELMYCEAAMRQVLESRQSIAEFDGINQTGLTQEFRRLDLERIRLAREEVKAVHRAGIPLGGAHGGVGIILGEISKKRRHRTVRKLLSDAGHAVRAIKPVFMMSPISVAQFLEPGALSFDLLVIDEASQVRPVEALGAILRCKQVVVVGDNRQLPPTAFFDRTVSGEEDEAELEGTSAGDVESILDLCVARGLPQRMLRWHYRSRHHSLIAVSNREFYENRLFVVPSPERDGSTLGLEFRYIADGVYDSGRTRTNRAEARAVAEAMIEHARTTPGLSLGVGAFSVAQRDMILDELESLRRSHPETERFFSTNDGEPWFVKNLENIQGDERDVILISVGYGRDSQGSFAMNFGPLNPKGGERRLNVLISRAKSRCVVFCSFHSDEIDLRRTNSRGAEVLKSYLKYAETGSMDLARPSMRDHDSEFEAQVADLLRTQGFEVDAQVGIAGFFIDLAVIDPEMPGRYLLGIECDGASYHSSRWARDRDRLRQAVLERHGWQIHRIWSTDWFHAREEQFRKLIGILEGARTFARDRDRDSSEAATTFSPEQEAVSLSNSPSSDAIPFPDEGDEAILESGSMLESGKSQTVTPYEEASFEHPFMEREIHELAAEELAEIVGRIVQVEGPIHGIELARRVTSLWGLQRMGARIESAVRRAIDIAVQRRGLEELDGFYTTPAQKEFPVRSRETVGSSTLRKPEMLPPQELDAAIISFVAAHISASQEEITRAVARGLGFKSTGSQLRSRIESRIIFLISARVLVRDRDVLRLTEEYASPSAKG